VSSPLQSARRLVTLADEVQDAAAVYRGTVILGFRSPIARLADASQDLAATVYLAEQHYLVMLLHGSEAARVRALEGVEVLLQVAPQHLKGAELDAARRLLAGRRRVLVEGWAGAEAHAAGLLGDIGRARAVAQADVLAARHAGTDLVATAAAVERMAATTVGATSGPGRSLQLLYQVMHPTDLQSWRAVYLRIGTAQGKLPGKVARIRKAGGVAAFGEEKFFRLLRPEASAVKGLVQEAAWWKSPGWLTREPELLRRAMVRARRLSGSTGRELQVLALREPLRDARTGREIYDGAILLGRPTDANPNVFEAFPDTLVQIKAEKRITVVRQVARDARRERLLPGDQLLRTSDATQAFVIRSAPDSFDPQRIIVAPQLPDASRFGRLPPGTDVAFDASLLDAAQLDDVAYLLLRAIIES
jgi:hypothetical protein